MYKSLASPAPHRYHHPSTRLSFRANRINSIVINQHECYVKSYSYYSIHGIKLTNNRNVNLREYVNLKLLKRN